MECVGDLGGQGKEMLFRKQSAKRDWSPPWLDHQRKERGKDPPLEVIGRVPPCYTID